MSAFVPLFICTQNLTLQKEALKKAGCERIYEDEKQLKERSIVFVAATRAKKSLLVTYYGNKSTILNETVK